MTQRRLTTRHSAAIALVLGALAALLIPGVASARPDDVAVISALGMEVEDDPHPVLGADGRNHLAYEITIVNQTDSPVDLNRVQPRANGKPLGPPLDGPALEGLLRINSGAEGTEIPAGGSALLFMDVTYPKKAKAPKRLSHGVSTTLNRSSGAQAIDFIGVPTRVSREKALVVEPPLRGERWVAANGCCNPINAHRGATLAIDGTVHVPERFAIDYVQLNEEGRLFEGPIDQNESYAYFGDQIHSATEGKVVRIQDGQPEQTPGSLPDGQTVQTAGGNFVVVKVDRDHFAFYAHMQPGSLTVEKGDRVKAGEVLGLLGNTGNTDAAHLHFHVMDGPSPLQSNGLPFVFRRFRGTGRVTDGSLLQTGEVVPVDENQLDGSYRKTMPMGLQVNSFGGS